MSAASPGDGPGLWHRLKGAVQRSHDDTRTEASPATGDASDSLVALARSRASGATGPVAGAVDGDRAASDGLTAQLREATGGQARRVRRRLAVGGARRPDRGRPFAMIVDDVQSAPRGSAGSRTSSTTSPPAGR